MTVAGIVAFSDPGVSVNDSCKLKDEKSEGLKFNNIFCFETLVNYCSLLPERRLMQRALITMISTQGAENKRKETKEKGNSD